MSYQPILVDGKPIKIVSNKSIRNVDDARLLDSMRRLHLIQHTSEGLHAFDGPRRELVDNGMKVRLITDELHRRGVPTNDCTFCNRRKES